MNKEGDLAIGPEVLPRIGGKDRIVHHCGIITSFFWYWFYYLFCRL